jgi:AraC-like DNA-binding protein
MFTEVLNDSEIYRAQDPHVVSDYVNQYIGSHGITIQDSTVEGASLWHRDFLDVALSRITYGNQVRVQSKDLEDIFHVQIVTRGVCYWRLADRDFKTQAGEILLLNPNDQVDLSYSEDCEKVIIKIPKRIMVSALADKATSIPKEGVKFDHVVCQTGQYQSLIYLLELIFLESESTVSGFSELAPYGNLLAIKLLDCFSNNIELCDDSKVPQCFSIIERYISEHIKDDLSIEDLAILGKVSQRTLYNIFARQKSVTPMHYIKQQKLIHVRKTLRDSSGIARNVTEVALDYGFMHLGRFSSEYKKMFGELPSATLKNRN